MQGHYLKASRVIRVSKSSAFSIQFFEIDTSSRWRWLLIITSKREDKQAWNNVKVEVKTIERTELKDR